LLLPTPQTGHVRSSGISSDGVPGAAEIRPTSYTDIYIGEIIRPLFSQSGSGAVFVVVRAVSATPYRKTISPQTAQLSLLLLSLSMIGTTDGFLSDKSIRKLNDLVNTTLSMTPNPIFIRGGEFLMGES
jgi:hypothetical protein